MITPDIKTHHLWFVLFVCLSGIIAYISDLLQLILTGDTIISWSSLIGSCLCSIAFISLFIYHSYFLRDIHSQNAIVLVFHQYIIELSTFIGVCGYALLHVAFWGVYGWSTIVVCMIFYTTFIYTIALF